MLPNSETFIQMLEKPEAIIETILKDMDTSEKNSATFHKLVGLYAHEPNKVNVDRALAACAKSLRHTNELNRRILLILLTYVSGSNFTSDAGNILIKMGRGEEALQSMFKKKTNGG